MKRSVLLLLLLLAPSVAQAQGFLKNAGDSITILDGLEVKVGDVVHLGQGSTADKHFIYVYTSAMEAAPNTFAGRKYKITELMYSDRGGRKYFGILDVRAGLFLKYRVDLESAIRFGEVIGLNEQKFDQNASPATHSPATASVADELKKLKELLDQGVLTQDEFDQQKRALLEKNK